MIRFPNSAFAAFTFAIAYLGFGGSAQAQSAGPWVNLNLRPVQTFADAAAAAGIDFNSHYLGEFAANPSGGARQGQEYTGELNLGADFDLGKIAGLNGGTIHVLFTDRAGNNLASKSINNSLAVQQKYGDGQTYQLTIFSYEQEMFDNKMTVKLGRIDITEDFIASPLYCDFVSFSSCSNPGMALDDIDIGSSYYPLSVWGGVARFNFTPNLYLKTGIYQGAPNLKPASTHGFDWSLNRTDGFQTAAEIGYEHMRAGAMAADQYDIGIEIDRTHYSAPYYDSGQPTRYGRGVVYAQAQKMLFQPASGRPQGLYGFAAALIGTSGSEQESNFSIETAAIYQGIIPGRPLDDAGFAFDDVHYNGRFLNYLYGERVSEGGTQRPAANLVMLELNYTAQLTPWLNVTPNLQYIIHPDGLGGLGYPISNEKNAFVAGLQFQVDIAGLAGLSPMTTP